MTQCIGIYRIAAGTPGSIRREPLFAAATRVQVMLPSMQPGATDRFTRATLLVIALLLAVLALRPAWDAPAVHAQSDYSYLFIEPGTTTLRTPDGRGQVQGKVVIDRRTGEVWGFPTGTSAPFPVVTTSSEPPVSKPIFLGRFDFSAMKRNP